MLEELGLDFDLEPVDLTKDEQHVGMRSFLDCTQLTIPVTRSRTIPATFRQDTCY